MIVDPSHRGITKLYPVQAYHTLAEQCTEEFKSIPEVSSVVVCGSLVKGTVVPGWSDLDLILFLTSSPNPVATLNHIRAGLNKARGETAIGVGVDLVYIEEFKRTQKFGGRPLAMTFEVAGYGEIWHGPSPFNDLIWNKSTSRQVAKEKLIAIQAELHNWRRGFLAQDNLSNSLPWLARSLKTCLKLLKYESDPNLEPPYTYEASLMRLSKKMPTHLALPIFERSVEFRRNWLNIINDVKRVESINAFLTKSLAEYLNLYV